MGGGIPTAFCDLDSTIADTAHRHHLVAGRLEGKPVDWVAYSTACVDDVPIPGTIRLLQLLKYFGVYIVLLSGRDVSATEQTKDWLAKHEVPYDDLILRDRAQREFQAEYKLGRLKAWIEAHPGHEIWLHMDDWYEVGPAFATEGIPTLFINPMYEAEITRQEDLNLLI